MTSLEHALQYATLGWAVLPLHSLRNGACTCGRKDCPSPGKHPLQDLVPHGAHDATKDPARITEWFTRVPTANVGIATGEPSGIVALDVDPRNGGDDLLADLERKHGKLPDTALQLTGGGGYHYIFRHTGARLKSPGRGIDVKGTGGYIVAEPSIHVSGGHYAWEGSADPTDGHTIANPPAWLLAPAPMPGTRPAIAGVGFLPPERIADIQAALQHIDASDYHTWIQVGQALHSTEAAEAFTIWDSWSQTAANYDNSTVAKWATFSAAGALHVESIFAWAKEKGWDPAGPRAPSKPDNVTPFIPAANAVPSYLLQLPGPLGTFVDLCNRTAPKPQPQFAVQAALALGCAVLGRRYKTTRENWPGLYLVNVGKSASGKEHPRTVLDAVLTAAQLGHLIGPGGYTSDGAVFSAAMNQPCHLAMIDELGAMLGNAAAMGNFHKRQALDALTQAWGLLNGTLRPLGYSTMSLRPAQRAELGSRIVHRPAISILGMTTPKTFYRSLNEQSIEGGFLNRLLVVESYIGRVMSRPADPIEVPDSLIEWCKGARQAQQGNLTGTDLPADVVPTPRVVDFTPDAKAAFRAYEAEVIESMDLLEPEGLAELEGRSVEKALRIALTIAVSDNLTTPFIHASHANWAIAYVRFYTAQTVASIRTHMHGSLFAIQRGDVLDVIRKAGPRGRTERELGKASRTFAGLDPRNRRAILDSLKADGLADFVSFGHGPSGRGRERNAWVATQDEQEQDDAA